MVASAATPDYVESQGPDQVGRQRNRLDQVLESQRVSTFAYGQQRRKNLDSAPHLVNNDQGGLSIAPGIDCFGPYLLERKFTFSYLVLQCQVVAQSLEANLGGLPSTTILAKIDEQH